MYPALREVVLVREGFVLAFDSEYVESGDARADAEEVGEARLRPAVVARDEFLDVEAAGAVNLDGGVLVVVEFARGGVHLASAGQVRAPVVDALGCVLLYRRTVEFSEGVVEGVGVDWVVELDDGAVGLARVQALDAFDHVVGGAAEAFDFDGAVGEGVDVVFEAVGVDSAAPRFLHLNDEGAAGAEHQGVDVLTARAVEDGVDAVHHVLDEGGDEALDAVVVEVARPAAVVAGLAPLSSAAVALAAGPLGLGDVAFEFAVATVDEGGVYLRLDAVGVEVDEKLYVRALEVDFGVGEAADEFADLAVEFGLEQFAGVRVGADFLAEHAFVLLDERRRPRPDLIGVELDVGDGLGGAFGPVVEGGTPTLTHPAVFGVDGVERLVVVEGGGDAERATTLGVGQSEAPVGEDAPETRVTHRSGRGELARVVEEAHTETGRGTRNCLAIFDGPPRSASGIRRFLPAATALLTMTSVKEFRVEREPTATTTGRGRFAFTDDYSVFDWGQMPDQIPDKGRSLCTMGAFNFELLEDEGVPTHYRGVGPDAVPLAEADDAPRELAIDLVQVPDLPFEDGTYDYDAYHAAAGDNYLIPLEIVFRNTVPVGSSLRSRGDPSDYGVDYDSWPDETVQLPEPVVEFSTKYEEQDRYLDRAAADRIAGAADIDALDDLARTVNRVVTEQASRTGFVHEDGKIECLYDDGTIAVADVVGTFDENRFAYDRQEVSKEVVRQYYKRAHPEWVEAVSEAKAEADERGVADWRELCSVSPDPLPSSVVDAVAEMYAAGANAYTAEAWFDAPRIDDAVDAVRNL